MTVRLEELLAAATPGDRQRDEFDLALASQKLANLSPDMARRLIETRPVLLRLIAMEESHTGEASPDRALLARLDRLGDTA